MARARRARRLSRVVRGNRRRGARVLLSHCQLSIDYSLSLPDVIYTSPLAADLVDSSLLLRGWLKTSGERANVTVELIVEGTTDSDPWDSPTWVEIDRTSKAHNGNLELLYVDPESNLDTYIFYRFGIDVSANTTGQDEEYVIEAWARYFFASRRLENSLIASPSFDIEQSDIRRDLTVI